MPMEGSPELRPRVSGPAVGGMPVPVPFHVRFGPDGVIVPPEGEAAKLSQPKEAPNAQRKRVMRARRLKRPDCKKSFCIGVILPTDRRRGIVERFWFRI